ncbi:cytochrome b561 and DOMON domain-containing protein At4g12980-like [Coffea arabica]|uniref:Cytochrome b561 and DOMON domain-containing protein At4g12980-like n=1 Tax=Coffea arabica TaxID=13443 RepID=A0A6P6XCP3_COFAR|nr:cytochrome b561 and DOMON domain-containing protein At4g12980-like [Coffea arabica]
MASSFAKPLLILSALLLSLLISPSQSATCSSQTLSNNKLYAHCNDLPSLDSYLHYSYDPVQSTLSVAFIAPPAKPNGWIAWAINPTGSGMLGAQSLIAFRNSAGQMTVKTYNITSYAPPIKESKVWFSVKDATAEYSGNVIRLFATLVLPEEATSLNHVWQVGASVTNGVLDKHYFSPANLNAKGSLDLLSGSSSSSDSRVKKKNVSFFRGRAQSARPRLTHAQTESDADVHNQHVRV